MADPPPHPGPPPAGAADDRGVGRARATNAGPGRVLVGLYGLFAVAAGARAAVQIATRFAEAPLAYLLSALAAAVYVIATIGLALSGPLGRRIAVISCTVELVGVLAVGTVSVLDPAAFPDDTVWSSYGRGYGFVPLVLPVIGLYWLRRGRASAPRPTRSD